MLLSRDVFARLCRARDLLADFPEDPRRVRDVARDVAISPFHFIRQFEAVFGMTPHQFRIGARVDRAKELLVRGELSVTEVCFEVGFSSLGTFSRMFAHRVGESPSAFRQRIRSVVQVPVRLDAWRGARSHRATSPLVHVAPPGCLTLFAYGSPVSPGLLV